jgi:hypothetical protein
MHTEFVTWTFTRPLKRTEGFGDSVPEVAIGPQRAAATFWRSCRASACAAMHLWVLPTRELQHRLAVAACILQ